METSKPKFVISIALMDNGTVSVSGPLHDKILCFGMLEIAKQVVATAKVEENKIQVPSLAFDPSKIGKGN
jgi:hypothetical protein